MLGAPDVHGGDVAHVDVGGGADARRDGWRAAGEDGPDGGEGGVEVGGGGGRLDGGADDDARVDGGDGKGGLRGRERVSFGWGGSVAAWIGGGDLVLVLPLPYGFLCARLRGHVEQAGRGAVAEFVACAQRVLVPVGFGEGVGGLGGVVDGGDGGGEDEGGELRTGVVEGGVEDGHGAADGGDDEVVPGC